jgi:hypothetical protein
LHAIERLRVASFLANLWRAHAVGLDRLLARLDDPAHATLRRSALRRWPLTTKSGRPTKQRR